MIILATHFEPESLPHPFIEIQRQAVGQIPGTKTDAFVWSEYAALLSRPATGWMHYRCVLDPTRSVTTPQPWESRYSLLERLRDAYDPEITYVGEEVSTHETLIRQFMGSHHFSVECLFSACDAYTRLTGDDARLHVLTHKGLTGRNIMVGPLVREWASLAKELILELDRTVDGPPGERWGGYVMERLFSFFSCSRTVTRVPFVYFQR